MCANVIHIGLFFPLHGIIVHLERNLMPYTCKLWYMVHSKMVFFFLMIQLINSLLIVFNVHGKLTYDKMYD